MGIVSSTDDLLCGIPNSFWNAVSPAPLSLMLIGNFEPLTLGLIPHLKKISDYCLGFQTLPRAIPAALRTALSDLPLFSRSDPYQLPLNDNQFDLVIAVGTSRYCQNPKDHLREVQRVLRPDGALLMIEGLDLKGSSAQDLFRDMQVLAMEIDLAQAHRQITFFTPSEIIELAHQTGFRDVQARKVVESSTDLTGAELDLLRDLTLQVLTGVYSEKIAQFPGGLKRWGKRLNATVQSVQTEKIAAPPYLILLGFKPRHTGLETSSRKIPAEATKYDERQEHNLISYESAVYPLRFRDLPDEFKPREKLILHGPAALKNHELLAILLVSGTTKENVLELSRRLIQEYGSRAIAQERSVRRLQETLSLGMNKACQIVAAFELGRRFFEEPAKRSPTILTAEDAYEYVRDMSKFTKEHFRGLYLNTRNRVLRDEIVSIGTLNMSVVHPREVFLPAVEFSAAAVILAHNHPSGDPTPSDEDLEITKQMVAAGKVMGIEVFDHLIIGSDSFVSLQQEGKLK